MTTFDDRFTPARKWEVELAEGLRARGWQVTEFGQGQLTPDAHQALREWRDSYGRPSLIRWLPDLLAWRGPDVYMVDAKSESGRDTGNVAVELDAFQVGVHIEQILNTPMLYVWKCGAATPRLIENRWKQRKDGLRTNGSGTSFLLVDKSHLQPLSVVFGDRQEAA